MNQSPTPFPTMSGDPSSVGRIPFSLSTDERAFMLQVAETLSTIDTDKWNLGRSLGGSVTEGRQILLDHEDGQVCLCSGAGERLGDVLLFGAAVFPLLGREDAPDLANRLAARMALAWAAARGETEELTDWWRENTYRAMLDRPLVFKHLYQTQSDLATREAGSLAAVMGYRVQADEKAEDPIMEVQPLLFLENMATGGRPGRIGRVDLHNPGTFFATFAVRALPESREGYVRTNLQSARELREALAGLARAQSGSDTAPSPQG